MLNPKNFIRTLQWRDGKCAQYVSLSDLSRAYPQLARYPAPLKIILESMVRRYDGEKVSAQHVAHMLDWHRNVRGEIAFFVSRVLLQDASGIPLLADLAALRTEAERQGLDVRQIEPEIPVDLVIDHSVIADRYGDEAALNENLAEEFRQNRERYEFVKWAQQAFTRLRVIPPGTGIVHQVNLEYLATGIVERDGWVFSDTLIGTDSHTTMVNSIGVLGWGVGGLEAEATLLGEPLYFDSPDVVDVVLEGALSQGITATDLALHLTKLLRQHDVVGKILDFHGPGARALGVPDRATVANMAPEYGATAAWFGIDEATFNYYRLTGRAEAAIVRFHQYCEVQGLLGIPDAGTHDYSEVITLDLSAVGRVVAGPALPQQMMPLHAVPLSLGKRSAPAHTDNGTAELSDGDVVLAAITSCTNTANPVSMIAAGLLAKAAVERGICIPPHVKTVLAPGSRAVTVYLRKAGLLAALETLGFHVSAFGCAACVGNTGALAPGIEDIIADRDLTVAAVLSGNRNFEGRIHRLIKANYLASPALVIAYALAGSTRGNLEAEPCGLDRNGQQVFLSELWPDSVKVAELVDAVVNADAFKGMYSGTGSDHAMWAATTGPSGNAFKWDVASSYFVEPPFFCKDAHVDRIAAIEDARVLAVLGDAITTDHISPVGTIAPESDAAHFLDQHGVALSDFNTYGARRCNHHVMVRGTFGSPRLRNALAAPHIGALTRSARDGGICSIHNAAMENIEDGVSSIIFAGRNYGSGSARDWAAKGTALLGVRMVIAGSFERIHRSNLVLMGVLPVEVADCAAWSTVEWTGREHVSVRFGTCSPIRAEVHIQVRRDNVLLLTIDGHLRIDTHAEQRYLRFGGMLPYLATRNLVPKREAKDRKLNGSGFNAC
jgi:aconitate hydratase